MGMTLTEKVMARNSGRESVSPGEIVEAAVNVAMLHDVGTPGVQEPLKALGVSTIPSALEVVIIQDHFVPAPTVKAAENIKLTQEYGERMGIENYYGVGRGGICHQVMPEKGHVRPGEIIIGTDSHTTTYGAFGALGTGVGVTDMAIVLGLGKLWLRVPGTVRVEITGVLGPAVSAKDVALMLLKEFGEDGLLYDSVELVGPAIDSLSMDSRMCLCDMAVEMGAKFAVVPPDEKTRRYLQGRTRKPFSEFHSDPDARFERSFQFDVSNLKPLVAIPHSPSNVEELDRIGSVSIDQAFLVSCTNGRLEDLRIAAGILKGKKVHPRVRLIVAPASRDVYLQALDEGLIRTFVEAEGTVTPPTCGACVGGHLGLLASGEVCISSSNRNFRGRMGSKDAAVYLASPATVAASALAGKIVPACRAKRRGAGRDPREVLS
ncbi:MAG: 3-isopropylmalate dehydratase large subunit [Candidatus Tectomicrobia bacterium]|uniref:3-isopropylmalate dehydratase large subunit n=1 Tax=Tectimicrobiota bacterium TaxID=2528274 RepID=A0A932GMM1_UNCTE|nr:3-isopropylmalate dehydratase large subunit [Candidatus Tectomicrobia bacterium]